MRAWPCEPLADRAAGRRRSVRSGQIRRELPTLLGGAAAASERAQHSSKNDYRDAEAIGHRT